MHQDERLNWQHKGLPPGSEASLNELGTLGWNVLAGEVGTPAALLRASALAHNLRVMAEFCRRHEVLLAPHAKTTMSPELIGMQQSAGAWAFTAAVPHQVAALQAFGVKRIILANQLTDPGALRWVADMFAGASPPELIWYVDSVAGVALAEESLPARPPGQRPQVLVEVGHRGGRTGTRTLEEALNVARSVHTSDRLDLVGVAGFEGTLTTVTAADEPAWASNREHGWQQDKAAASYPATEPDRQELDRQEPDRQEPDRQEPDRQEPDRQEPDRQEPDRRGPEVLAAVDEFLRLISDVFGAISDRGYFLPGCEPIVSAGGSMYFDRVVAAFEPLRALGARIVLRSGCYLSHDDGMYDAASPARAPGWSLDVFQSAIEVWGRVLSRPEPELALVNFGRRDVSFDAGLPVPRWLCRRGASRPEPASGLAVTGLSDQHAFVRTPPGHPIAVGDLLGVGISHPCTTFDRWRLLFLVDDDYRVTGGVRTFF